VVFNITYDFGSVFKSGKNAVFVQFMYKPRFSAWFSILMLSV